MSAARQSARLPWRNRHNIDRHSACARRYCAVHSAGATSISPAIMAGMMSIPFGKIFHRSSSYISGQSLSCTRPPVMSELQFPRRTTSAARTDVQLKTNSISIVNKIFFIDWLLLMIYPKNNYWNPSSSRVKDFMSSDPEVTYTHLSITIAKKSIIKKKINWCELQKKCLLKNTYNSST